MVALGVKGGLSYRGHEGADRLDNISLLKKRAEVIPLMGSIKESERELATY